MAKIVLALLRAGKLWLATLNVSLSAVLDLDGSGGSEDRSGPG
ncbi:MAG: hypothetical protein AABN34_29385 [Acidobacteriota bacterium]